MHSHASALTHSLHSEALIREKLGDSAQKEENVEEEDGSKGKEKTGDKKEEGVEKEPSHDDSGPADKDGEEN